jgi:sugar lactone lactonase YvrE
MNPRLGWYRSGLLFGALFALAIGVLIPGVVRAAKFMSDSQDAQRPLFPVAKSNFIVAAGDTIADRVLGQMDFVHATENFATASTLDLGRSFAGVAIDQSSVPNRVYVADFSNHRVLGWSSASALTNGKPANIVIGQPDFFSTACNNGGVSASSLCGPVGVAVDGSGDLYVADTFNNRVLEYNTPFTNTGEPGSGDRIADQVFGQEGNFSAKLCNLGAKSGATSSTLCEPAGIAIDPTGVLYIADQRNNRVLEYLFPLLDGAANDVFGQGGQFSTTVCNKGGISAASLCNPIGVATDGGFNNLYVADADNSRVLEYNNPPANDTSADNVFGQGSSVNKFSLAKCNGGGSVPSAATLCGPDGVTIDTAGHLYVADRSNSRVLEYTTFPIKITANKVFGQGGNLGGKACNFSGNTDGAGLCGPGGVALDSSGNLYVADDDNNRVLKYNSALSGDTTADVVLGQVDFAHSDRNEVDASGFGGDTADIILAGSVDIAAFGAVAIDNTTGRIYVADNHNNRVLGFNNAASFANGAPASVVIGQQNFFTGSSKACFPNSATSSTLN